MLAEVMDRMTADTVIGRILMPGPTYLGMWARDTGVAALGLNRMGKWDLAGELLSRYWGYQITEESDPARFVFRNKRFAAWTDADAFRPTRRQLLAEAGAFPTSVYIETPNFPAGTCEIYSKRADLDSAGWLIIALHDYYCHSHDGHLLRRLAPQVARAVAYLRSRDADGDHLLEQGRNEDWADILLRHGKVAYTQAVWYKALDAASHIFSLAGDEEQAAFCRQERELVRAAINQTLVARQGYYVNYLHPRGVSLRRSVDTALLVAFGIADDAQARAVLHTLQNVEGPFGAAVVAPGYAPTDIGPAKYPPGQYQNEGIWPWIASYLALAWAAVGNADRARAVLSSILGPRPRTVHEWIDNLSGERHHADFATGAGALAWAITEGGLAPGVHT
jgi:glycogen debranching enzyme